MRCRAAAMRRQLGLLMLRLGISVMMLTIVMRAIHCQVELVIGVEDNGLLSALQDITTSASRMSAELPDAAGLRLRFVQIDLPAAGDAAASVTATAIDVAQQLSDSRVRAVVGNYHPSIAIASQSVSLQPVYLVSKLNNENNNEDLNLPMRNNLFECDVDYRHLALAVSDLADADSLKHFYVLYDDSYSSKQFRNTFANLKILSLYSINTNTSNAALFNIFASVATSSSQIISNAGWILLLSDSNLGLIDRALTQAARAGLLASSQTFFLPNLVSVESQLRYVYKTEAALYSFRLRTIGYAPRHEVSLASAVQCVNHLSLAFKEQIRTGRSLVNTTLTVVSNSITFSSTTHTRSKLQLDILRNNRTATAAASTGDGSVLTLAGFWHQGASPAFVPVFLDDGDIKSSVIRFGSLETAPYLYRNLKGEWAGLSYDIADALSKMLGFRFQIVLAPDNFYGARLSNGSWNGIMRLLQDNKADISINLMTPTKQRLEICDRSIDLVEDGVQMLSFKIVHAPDFLHTFYPFSFYVWMSILIAIVLLSLTLLLSDKISPNIRGKPMFSVFSSFFLVFSSFLMSKVETEPRKLSSRLFTLLLWFSTLMYVTTYLSNLVAFMVQPIDAVRFSTLSELENEESMRYGFMQGSAIVTAIREKWPGLIERAEREWPSRMYFNSYEEAFKLVSADSNFIAIEGADSLSYVMNRDCQLRMIGNIEDNNHLTLLSRKGFRFKQQIDEKLRELKSTRLAQMRSKYFDLNRCLTGRVDVENKNKLGFNYLRGQFLILGIGCALGILQVFLQRFISQCRTLFRRKSNKHLVLGECYEAAVLSTNADGCWIQVEGRDEAHFLSKRCEFANGNAQIKDSVTGDKICVRYFDKDVTGSKIFIHVNRPSEYSKKDENLGESDGQENQFDYVDASVPMQTALATSTSARRNTAFRVQIEDAGLNDSHI